MQNYTSIKLRNGEGNGNPLQYSCLEYPMDEGAWQATVQGVTKELDTTLQLNNNESHPLECTEQPHPQAEDAGANSTSNRGKKPLWTLISSRSKGELGVRSEVHSIHSQTLRQIRIKHLLRAQPQARPWHQATS